MIDPQVQEAISAVRQHIQSQESYSGEEVHPVNAARELQVLGIQLTEEQGQQFLNTWLEGEKEEPKRGDMVACYSCGNDHAFLPELQVGPAMYWCGCSER